MTATRNALLTLALLLCALPLFADSSRTKERTVTQLADGVYEIRHPDAFDGFFPQSNTLVVIGDKDVLVVDSCWLPSAAKEDIAQIRKWTNKPVRYLVNTHWHGDHNWGNYAYAAAFPGLQIIAHKDTRDWMASKNVNLIPRWEGILGPQEKQQIDSGKKADGTPLTEKELQDVKDAYRGRMGSVAEWKENPLTIPNVTFDQSMSVDLGNRIVEVKWLGRANTSGDAIVWLPKEKVLATGDILVAPVPYLFGGFAQDMIGTLEKLKSFNAAVIVPGHGDLQRDHKHIETVQALLQTTLDHVRKEVDKFGATLESVKKDLDLSSFRQQMAGDDKDSQEMFDASIARMIEVQFNEQRGR